jgi:hypothetical protein
MFVLTSKITVVTTKGATITWSGVNECKIKRSINSYVDTCTLMIPISAKLTNKLKPEQIVYTINRGDKITVELGYNGRLVKEFEGFVARVNYTMPCEIECEGYSYQLKRNNINKSFGKSTTLKEVLENCVEKTNIKLSDSIPDMKLYNYKVTNAPASKVLDNLKEQFKVVAYFRFNELYVGLEQIGTVGKVAYRLGWNTVDVNNLKYRLAEDVRLKVVVKTAKSDGGKDVYTVGDADGSVREMIIKNSKLDEVKKIADDYLARYKYTGFEGNIIGFLEPYAEHGYSCQLVDNNYPERNGTYFTTGVEVSFGQSGARRSLEINKKLSS